MVDDAIYNKINPFSLIPYYFSYSFFNYSHKFLNNMMSDNFSNYGISFIHSSTYCLFSLMYFILKNGIDENRIGENSIDNDKFFSTFWNFIKVYSSGYFIYDSLYIVKYQKLSFVNIVYLYHHLSSINLLRDDELSKHVFKMLCLAEISNLPSSIIYYLIKTNTKNKPFLLIMKKLQFIIYSFFRIPFIGYYLFLLLKKYPYNKNIYISLPIYFMGVVWTSKLYKGLKK